MENRYINMTDEEFKKETTIFKTTANLFFFFVIYITFIQYLKKLNADEYFNFFIRDVK